MDGNTGIKRSVLFYLILTSVMLISTYLPNAALITYPFIIVLLYILKRNRGGFRWGGAWKPGFFFGFILISLVFIFEFGLGWVKLEGLYSDAFIILIGAIIFELLVSIGEEMSFRGYILPELTDSLGTRKAVIATSLLFAGLHIPSILALGIDRFNSLIMFTTVTVAGILLALLYLIDGLKMPCGFHFSWNFFQYHIFSLRSGFGIFGLTAVKPEFTGGTAGPEAGLLGLAVLSLGTSVLLAVALGLRKE